MATAQSTVDDLLERLAGIGDVTARKMFGEYCLYLSGQVVALVCDDTLFVKPTAAARQVVPDIAEGPPYPGAKPHPMLPPDAWDDRDTLRRLIRGTFEALPPAKAKKKR